MQEQAKPAESGLLKVSADCRNAPLQTDDSESLQLDDSLAMTPWERILANDDMVNFGDSLRAAMERRNAEPR